MKIFLFVIRSAPGLTILALVTALLSGAFSGSLIALIHNAIENQSRNYGQSALLFAVLVGLTLASAIAANLVIAHLYRKVVLDVQIRLVAAITRSPLRQLEDIGSAALLVILTEDVDDISDTATELVPLITNAGTAIVCFGYLVWLSWQAFLGTLVFLIIGGLSYKFLVEREQQVLVKSRDEVDKLYGHFEDLTDGLKELKLNRKRSQAFVHQVLEPTAKSVERYMFKWDLAYTVISSWGRFLILAVVGLILFLLPNYLAVEPGTLTGYILALLYVRASLLAVMDTLPELAEAAVSLQKIESVGLDLAASSTALDDTTQLPTSWQSLKLVQVTHRYYREREDSFFTLGPISLDFQPGELVFLVGGNGSGKTTLAKLLTGLYPPESGQIYLDQLPICDRNRSDYSQLFAAIFTDFHLFDDLLGLTQDNLDDQAKHYLSKLQLDHKLDVHNGKLSTTALSRGQQQRLALLVAYLEDRPFYIFDEWASNQDPVFKQLFYTQFLPELKARGKTILVISHDDRYFEMGDRILKLTDGQLEHCQTTVL